MRRGKVKSLTNGLMAVLTNPKIMLTSNMPTRSGIDNARNKLDGENDRYRVHGPI